MAIPRFHDERRGWLPEKFFLALGHLQYAYTTLEVNLAHQIKNLITAGYHHEEHPQLIDRIDSVLGGMRMDVAKDTMKRTLRVMEAPADLTAYVGVLFLQVGEIQFFRNRLTHYGSMKWRTPDGPFVNTDLGLSREANKAVTIRFDYDALEAARHDLHAIIYYLERSIHEAGELSVLEPPAWQYKPAMLVR